MPLDTRLPLLAQRPKFISPADAAKEGIDLRTAQRGEQQAIEQQQAQKTLQDIYRNSVGQDGQVDPTKFDTSVAQAGLGDRLPDIQKNRAALGKTQAETEAAKFKLTKDRLDAAANGFASLIALPQITHQDINQMISQMQDQGLVTPDIAATLARSVPGRPEALKSWVLQNAMQVADAGKRLDTMLPKYDEQDRGGTISQGTIDPVTGVRTETGSVQKTATPGEILSSETRKANIQRLTDAQSEHAFTPDEGSLMAALAERGISLPAGMRSRAQMKSTFASLLSRNPDMSADDIAEKIATGQINIGAERKETQTAAGVAGRVAVAVNELSTFGDQVLEASNAIPRGQFVPWNRLKQMTDTQLSDPALIRFKTMMQSLNNAYDQLAARGGTDAEKRAHIASLFNTATSPEGVAALVKAVKDEGVAAEEAARKAIQRRQKPTEQAKGPGTGAAIPDDITAILQQYQ